MGRRLIRGFWLWCAYGEAADQFIPFTDGVVAAEQLEVPDRAASASLAETAGRTASTWRCASPADGLAAAGSCTSRCPSRRP